MSLGTLYQVHKFFQKP